MRLCHVQHKAVDCNYNPDATVDSGCEYSSCTLSASVNSVSVASSGGCSYYPRGLWNAYGPDGKLAYLPMYKVNNDATTGEYVYGNIHSVPYKMARVPAAHWTATGAHLAL